MKDYESINRYISPQEGKQGDKTQITMCRLKSLKVDNNDDQSKTRQMK
jgi:hypothetical protein